MRLKALREDATRNLLKGALLILPFLGSFAFVGWIARLFDEYFSRAFFWFGIRQDPPFGMGTLVGLIFLYTLGKLSDAFLAQHLAGWLERMVKRVPILGSIYSSIQDLAGFMKSSEQSPRGKAVIVTFDHPDLKIAGFLTKTDLHTLPTDDRLDDRVAVYIPLAYMVGGGFTVFVPRDRVRELNMPFDKAMQASLSAWMVNPR